jgi:hypothetical protein
MFRVALGLAVFTGSRAAICLALPQRLTDFIQESRKEPHRAYVLIKGASWCNPCLELEKFTVSHDLTRWPYFKKAVKRFIKVDVTPSEWKSFVRANALPDEPEFPVVYVFRAGKLDRRKVASAPWEIEKFLTP